MLFIPKKSKFKKYHCPSLKQRIYKTISYPTLITGVVGLKILEFSFLTPQQLQTMRFILNKHLKKIGTVRFFIFPNVGVSKKPEASRMGKGKGKLESWLYRVQPGSILCEINTRQNLLAIKALRAIQLKLPFLTKIITNSFK